MIYYLIVAISLRYLFFDYYYFNEYIHPYLMQIIKNKYVLYVYKQLRICSFCSGYQIGNVIYLSFLFDLSTIGTVYGWHEVLNMWLFAVASGYLSKITSNISGE